MSDWELILAQAKKCLQSNTTWQSFVRDRFYKIGEANEKQIKIIKISGGFPVTLTERIVNTALSKVKGKAIFEKGDLPNSVSRDATIIFLHPFYYWDKNKKLVFKLNAPELEKVENSIQQADDDEISKIWVLINQRKQQSKFRKTLITNYKGKCAISRCKIIDILDAAHILDHAKTGINKLPNGILLRTDLHGLFDCGKLLIEPETNIIFIHPDLKNSEYWIYNKVKINFSYTRIKPDKTYLKQKWDKYAWVNKVNR
jgi:hypothetical protein